MLLQFERFVFRLREMLSSALFRLRVTDGVVTLMRLLSNGILRWGCNSLVMSSVMSFTLGDEFFLAVVS